MSNLRIINTQLKAGIWQGDLIGAGSMAPTLNMTHEGKTLADITAMHDADRDVWQISVPIPAAIISDGLQTFLVIDGQSNTLASFSLLAGDPPAEDLRAEISLLRAELDMLKKAFRLHCHDD